MPHTRIALSLAALLLGASAPAHAGWFDFGTSKSDAKPAAKDDGKKAAAPATAPAQDLDGAIREAQLLRTDGHYDDAVKHLSQIMLVAADDPRVISEYGKTLAAMGRASEAVNFLTRAQQLAPNDWSVYSALGVAYDQTGDQTKAAAAYEHALALRPGEASVLNNYALSRMLAKDTNGAHQLIARAEAAGGGSDPKIARNIAMMKDLSPMGEAPQAVAMQAPPVAAPRTAVASRPMPQVVQSQSFANLPQPPVNAAPRPLMANNSGIIQPVPQQMMQQQPSGVVMQRVPEDPLAGPVLPKHIAAAIPNPPKAGPAKTPVRRADAAPAAVKTAMTPAAQANELEARAEAIAKQLNNKPAAQAQAIASAGKPEPGTPKPSDIKPAVKAADAPKAPAKVADAKPAPAPVKTADAKSGTKTPDAKAVPVKTATKDAVPALRVSASAY
jgi:Flp pilus assembly protein TadD